MPRSKPRWTTWPFETTATVSQLLTLLVWVWGLQSSSRDLVLFARCAKDLEQRIVRENQTVDAGESFSKWPFWMRERSIQSLFIDLTILPYITLAQQHVKFQVVFKSFLSLKLAHQQVSYVFTPDECQAVRRNQSRRTRSSSQNCLGSVGFRWIFLDFFSKKNIWRVEMARWASARLAAVFASKPDLRWYTTCTKIRTDMLCSDSLFALGFLELSHTNLSQLPGWISLRWLIQQQHRSVSDERTCHEFWPTENRSERRD